MWQQEFTWFFVLFHREFRQGNRIAFEVLMALAFAHFFGFYNPKQLADFLDIPHQKLYAQLKDWSVYYLKAMLIRFMVKQAVEHLKPVLHKSAATQSRVGCLNRPSAVDRFLDSSRQSRFSHVRWPNIFNHTRGLLGHQMRPMLIFTTR